MREALLRKRYGIPAALLLILLLSGTALAWYCFANCSSETTVQESLSVTETKEFFETMYPGETNTWSFNIVNSAAVAYQIKADLTFDAPNGVSIISFFVDGVDETSDLLDDGSAEFIILPSMSTPCEMEISAANDTTPGHVSVSLDLSRG